MSKRTGRRKTQKLAAKSKKQTPSVASPAISQELLEAVPDETRIAYIEAASFTGPLPPPALLGHYDKVLPGSAERIVVWAEREHAHRHDWDTKVLDAQKSEVSRGQWMGFVIALASLASAVTCAVLDKPYVAFASIVPVIFGIGTAYFKKNTPTDD